MITKCQYPTYLDLLRNKGRDDINFILCDMTGAANKYNIDERKTKLLYTDLSRVKIIPSKNPRLS